MDFSFSEDVQELKEAVGKFVQQAIVPIEMDIEENNEIPEEVIEQTKEMGLFGVSIPEEYGGLGLNMVGKCAVFEEIGKTHNGFTTLVGAHVGIGTVGIVELGTEEQKEKYLPKMAAGDWIGAFALTEASAGSHASNIKTTAVKKGDKYIINGAKQYITNAVDAHVFTVMTVTDPEKGVKGITAFIVEKDYPGFTMGTVEDKMGLRGSHSAEIFFDNMEVPSENILGTVGMGYINALKILANGRTGLAARNLGSCDKLFEYSINHALEREQFGKPIFEHQAVQHMLSEMKMDIETLRSMVYRVAWMTDEGKRIVKEASMAKLYGSEVYNKVADLAIQIHGGLGYIKEYPIERYYRDARITSIYEGTSQIQKNIIASELKREYN